MVRIDVGLGGRAYPVLIARGLVGQAGELVRPLLKRARTAVVTDQTVDAEHGAALIGSLEAAGIEAASIVLPPGEETKSFAQLGEDLRNAAAGGGLDLLVGVTERQVHGLGQAPPDGGFAHAHEPDKRYGARAGDRIGTHVRAFRSKRGRALRAPAR